MVAWTTFLQEKYGAQYQWFTSLIMTVGQAKKDNKYEGWERFELSTLGTKHLRASQLRHRPLELCFKFKYKYFFFEILGKIIKIKVPAI